MGKMPRLIGYVVRLPITKEAQLASTMTNDVVQKACIFPEAEENSVEAG
jgi:hypothetical protein